MADPVTIGGAITACAAALGTLIAAARQPADVATLRGEVKSAREALPADIKAAADAVRAALEGSIETVRGNLATVAKRVGDLESWRRTLHERSQAEVTGRNMIASGSDLSAQVDKEHERRIENLEARADRVDIALGDAREKLAGILATVQEILRRAK